MFSSVSLDISGLEESSVLADERVSEGNELSGVEADSSRIYKLPLPAN